MLKSTNLFKNTIIIGIGTICTKIISFIMVPFYTNWLIPEEYGNYDLIVSYLSLLIPIITFQLEQAIFRFSLKNKNDSKKYYYNALIITMLNIIIVDILALLILKNSIFKYSFIFYFDVYAIFVLSSEYLRGNNKLKEYSLYNIMVSVLIVITNLLLVYKLKFGAVGLMYSYGISYFLVSLCIVFKEKIYKAFKKDNIDKNILKDMLKYSIPMIPNGLSWWVINVSDRTMINFFIGSFYNGLYAVSCKIPTIMTLIYSVFNLSWQQTVILVNDDDGKKEYYGKIFKKLIFFLFTCAMLIVSTLPILYKFLISKLYYDSIEHVSLLLLGAVFLSLAQFLSGILLAQNDTKKIGFSTIISAIINVLINFIFMKKYGIIVASLSTLVAYIYLFANRYIMIEMNEKKKNILIILIMTCIYMFYSNVVIYINNLLMYCLCIICSGILFIILNRELINTILKKVIKFLSNKKKKAMS